jgi:DNA helicase-2/ATP-dependent DNA helicase PcrA
VPDISRLGRSIVVGPGQPVPDGWGGCERRAVTAIDASVAADLHQAWRERLPLIVELKPGIGLDSPAEPPAETVTGHQPWEWTVGLDLPGERLHHAIWANSVDGRDAARPAHRWTEAAIAAGATPAPADADYDVVLPDGRLAVCDGGPLDAGLADRIGLPVVHRTAIEHRSLRPLGRPAGRAAGALADDQRAAVTEGRAGARVIAPAGSGKTRVLTERARSLVVDWGLPPASIALVAYNVRAAGEMRARLADVPDLRIRTLNALALRLCGRSTTLDEPEVRRILGNLVSFPRRAEADPIAPWIEALSRVRLGLVAPDLVEEEVGDVSGLTEVWPQYRDELQRRDAVDFDQQVAGAIERLLGDPAFRARSQRFARVLLVDEFQDLTPAHMLLLRLLAGPAGAVFGVGDDDQTIYGYAGATPRWLVDFAQWFPGSVEHSLEVNYRCPPEVVGAAVNVLSRNAVRVPKVVRPARPTGATPGLLVREASPAPATATTDRVEELIGAGVDPVDIAVLSRVNASLVPVQVLLGHRQVPVDAVGDRRFLQRGGVRAALAWLEVATAPDRQLPGAALREAARRPKRGMSNGLLDMLARPRRADALRDLAGWLEEKGSNREADKVHQLAGDVDLVRQSAGRGTAAILGLVRRQVGGGGLDASASALDQWSHGAIAAHADDLDALTELAALEPDPSRFGAWLADRLSLERSAGGVTVASIHAVKGREWPHVIVHHASAGLMPHRLSTDTEEERRIFHVGLTRASETATLVSGPTPSPFIAEMAAPGKPEPAPTRADRTAVDPTTGRRPGSGVTSGSGGGTSASGRTGKADLELLAASPGVTFTSGGHEHEVVETAVTGAVCVLGGGPARAVVPFGATVTAGGRAMMLAHPAAPGAWERLRAWRTDRATHQKVPPYVIFDDQTLRLVAAHLPVDERGLLALRGVGPAKFGSYGAELIAVAEEFREQAAM